MTLTWASPSAQAVILQRIALAGLAIALLLTGFAGRAGVQVVDGAIAARMFALHLHGVPGEAEFVQATGTPAPFVHAHCHAPLSPSVPQPDPDVVQAASTLAGSAVCTASAFAPVTPLAVWDSDVSSAPTLQSRFLAPALEPPR
jgi:hypothetical protein